MLTAESVKRTKTYKRIKTSLEEQLERSGNDSSYFLDLVDDYMKMYVIKELANADIMENGTTVEWRNSENQFGRKKNDAVDQVLKTNAQMLKLLDMLGIKPETGAMEDDEEL